MPVEASSFLALSFPDASDQREDIYIGNHIPCSESFNGYCIHGKCEFIYSTQKASCRCESGYTGQHCEKTDFSILYVVPSRQKLTHVLIAAIIGAVQIAIIVAIVMCITRKPSEDVLIAEGVWAAGFWHVSRSQHGPPRRFLLSFTPLENGEGGRELTST
ncbi:UNVERIFIED_CONTAM: Tomoregulin-1 [Gekko kuhli]